MKSLVKPTGLNIQVKPAADKKKESDALKYLRDGLPPSGKPAGESEDEKETPKRTR